MKNILDSNPILVEEWIDKIKPIKAKSIKTGKKIKLFDITTKLSSRGNVDYGVIIEKDKIIFNFITKAVGQHNFPPAIKNLQIKDQAKIDFNEKNIEGFRPEHLSLSPFPKTLNKDLFRQFWTPKFSNHQGKFGLPTSVYSPDTRYNFNDTAFPWCTCGKVEVSGGWGSGVMIGPRHLMTASHAINWGNNNTAGWVKFTPSYFDGSAPFGFAYATKIYSWSQVNGSDGVDTNESAFNYVVCVLDSRIGDLTGWMGSKGYSTDWNGSAYWSHIGYPSDMAGGQRPSFIGDGVIDSTDNGSSSGRTSLMMSHKIDVIPGQSGGPFFGWWDREEWPRVVGIQSTEQFGGSNGPNTCGGGNPLAELINYVRTVEP